MMPLNERLNIQHASIQVPMAGVQNHGLAVAVSNAGGLPTIQQKISTALTSLQKAKVSFIYDKLLAA